ncbi:MAG: phosphoribosylamine--glycine ligase [Rickettsiales bacterium]|nr:phosphoribosylamine--glycine ligase [Rickettsiales bacterium]
MNLLIIGSGAREHAIAAKIHASKHNINIYVSNPNPGISKLANSVILDTTDFNSVKDCIINFKISFVIVGPEIPLIIGIYDFISNDKSLSHVRVIGPSKIGAKLEGSKVFAKNFMKKYNIPTASYSSFDKTTLDQGIEFINNSNSPFVLKADGPAAGKGVIIVDNKDEAIYYLKDMLINSKFGKSSQKVIIEEFLNGIEMSCFILFDGINYKILPYAKDYKRIGEGDTGFNTGGMGSISPVNFLDEDLKNKIENKIIKPTINGLIKEKINYVGFIFIGLINTAGNPKVIEYNVRMGDPEAQVVLPRIKNDFMDLMISCANQNLDKIDLEFDSNYYTNVVLASGGYPEEYKKGFEITGLNNVKDSLIFHAGTAINNEHIVTNGGRVLSVVSSSKSMKEALKKSYSNIEKINFKGKVFRKDIGFDL